MLAPTYHFDEEENVFSPSLIYYKDVIINNTKKAIEIAGGASHLWPHVKSHKCADIIQLSCNAGIRRFKCATIAEAEITATTDAGHILLAYPLVGPNISRFISLVKAYPNKKFYALEDNLQMTELLSEEASKCGVTANIMIDVNTGMNRTGVPFDQLAPFATEVSKLQNIAICGLHVYDGNRHEKDYDDRLGKVLETTEKIKQAISALSIPDLIVIAGGSPSFPCYTNALNDKLKAAYDRELLFFSPGTVFIYDAGYSAQFPDLPYVAGAAILSRIVSHPAKGMFTIDCGYKAISAEQERPGIMLSYPNASPAFQSEEHWTWKMDDGHEEERPSVGSIVYIIPWHICPTTALYGHVNVVSDGHLTGKWNVVARDRIIKY